jgi:hypothetical protein
MVEKGSAVMCIYKAYSWLTKVASSLSRSHSLSTISKVSYSLESGLSRRETCKPSVLGTSSQAAGNVVMVTITKAK